MRNESILTQNSNWLCMTMQCYMEKLIQGKKERERERRCDAMQCDQKEMLQGNKLVQSVFLRAIKLSCFDILTRFSLLLQRNTLIFQIFAVKCVNVFSTFSLVLYSCRTGISFIKKIFWLTQFLVYLIQLVFVMTLVFCVLCIPMVSNRICFFYFSKEMTH